GSRTHRRLGHRPHRLRLSSGVAALGVPVGAQATSADGSGHSSLHQAIDTGERDSRAGQVVASFGRCLLATTTVDVSTTGWFRLACYTAREADEARWRR